LSALIDDTGARAARHRRRRIDADHLRGRIVLLQQRRSAPAPQPASSTAAARSDLEALVHAAGDLAPQKSDGATLAGRERRRTAPGRSARSFGRGMGKPWGMRRNEIMAAVYMVVNFVVGDRCDRPLRWQRRWPRLLAQALLPSSCALCGARCAGAVCLPCHAQFVTGATRCPRCANPVGSANARRECAQCLARRPAFDATLAGVDYVAPLDRLVLQLKFGGQLALAPWFAGVLRDAVIEQRGFVLPNVLCPVPLGPQRLRERGFNQALEMARPLARELGIALQARLAIRARDTPAQSGVSPDQRRRNMRNAFSVAPQLLAMVRGQHIGVVDDVMTSGTRSTGWRHVQAVRRGAREQPGVRAHRPLDQ
jgi:ComF family protein